MPVRNQHWSNIAEGTDYPLDDAATALTDDGRRLPTDLVTDLQLRFPATLGDRPFLAAVAATGRIVTVAFQADDGTGRFAPLAVATAAVPVVPGRPVPLVAQAAGVGGWVVFGPGANQRTWHGRFDGPAAGGLTPRAARAYAPLPVAGAQVLHAATALTGVVRLAGQSPVVVRLGRREVGGALRDVVVIGLTTEAEAEEALVPDAGRQAATAAALSVFQAYAGPCAGRPESGTCPGAQPIEFVNAVGPDCDGVLTLEFRGCAVASRLQDVCGVVVECALGLAEACLPPFVPASDGRLPSEYDPTPADPPTPPDPPVDPPTSESVVAPGGELPYTDCFDDGVAEGFVVKVGAFAAVIDDGPAGEPCDPLPPVSLSASTSSSNVLYSLSVAPRRAYATATAATRCAAVWDGFDPSTLGRRYRAAVKLRPGPPGAKRNAHLVLNYRDHATNPGQVVYYLAEVDYDAQELRVRRWNGTALVPAVAVFVPGILLDRWYELRAAVTPAGSHTAIAVELREPDGPAVAAVGPLLVTNYAPSTGWAGVGADRAVAHFAWWRVEEVA